VEAFENNYNDYKTAGKNMQTYTLSDLHNHTDEVFDQAADEPVLLTEDSQRRYVIMSAKNYQQLVERLAALEDRILGRLAEVALQSSQMVGTEAFTAELKHLADLDSTDF
jgi:prevent-host-death family protein